MKIEENNFFHCYLDNITSLWMLFKKSSVILTSLLKWLINIKLKLSAPELSVGSYKQICFLTNVYRRIFPELWDSLITISNVLKAEHFKILEDWDSLKCEKHIHDKL